MVEDLPDVPPAFLLVLREISRCASWPEARRRIKGMLTELRDQSEAFERESLKRTGYSRDATRFQVHLHGALDLLTGHGCIDFDCRVEAANRVARSVGLIADRVWLTDTLSERFARFGRPTNAKLEEIIADTIVLSRLLPLILAGVVRFRSPLIPTCRRCVTEFDMQLQHITTHLAEVFRRDFRLERREDEGFVAYTGKCLEPPLVFHSVAGARKHIANTRSFIEYWVAKEARSVLWVAREASLTGGSVMSNSRIGLAGLLQREGRLPDKRGLLLLDKEREFSVPWVSELDASQVVQLREEASTALPAFRERMAKLLSLNGSDAPSGSPGAIISDLREQASEVRAELNSKRAKSARFWKTTYGVLGLGLSAYGVAADQVLPGVGGLLPILHLLINHKTGYETEIAKLTSRPGFVLVKAQDILAHAHNS